MKRRLRTVGMASAVAATVVLGVLPASAATDSGWVPVEDSDPYQVKACGTTLTVSEMVNDVESRTRVDDQGTTRTDYRGRYVNKVTAADGRKVRLDNSGPYSVFDYANGDKYGTIKPPALIAYQDKAERSAFAAAGLPPVFYYTRGRLDLYIRDGQEQVLQKPADPVSICTLLH